MTLGFTLKDPFLENRRLCAAFAGDRNSHHYKLTRDKLRFPACNSTYLVMARLFGGIEGAHGEIKFGKPRLARLEHWSLLPKGPWIEKQS
ncbi:MAG: hypothetical protein DMG40_22480 [Acidobacteria bacterium]|nr:MAG: hypothetical protein DMG40_22480 [Acidobacteriota bacterium]